jgi:phenylalanyl-tRNA synthetase beta chain
LFETANVYLPNGNQLPREQLNLGCIAESELRILRGVFEEILHRVWGVGSDTPTLSEMKVTWDFLESGSGIAWMAGETMLCWIGSLSRSLSQSLKLDGAATLGEMNLDLLLQHAQLVPRVRDIVPFPAIERDLNLVVDEALQWQSLQGVIAQSAGPLCVDILFREIYRDTKRDGASKKRVLLTLKLQSATDTLRSEQADEVVASVLGACQSQLGAQLLA